MQSTYCRRTALPPVEEQPTDTPLDFKSHLDHSRHALAAFVLCAANKLIFVAALTRRYAPACNDPAATGRHNCSRERSLLELSVAQVSACWLWLQCSSLLQGGRSAWQPFLDSLPEQTESPMLWPRSEQEELLQGSPVLREAQQRSKALDEEWQSLSPALPSLLQSSGGALQGAHGSTGSIKVPCKQRCVVREGQLVQRCESSAQPPF